MTTSVIYKLRDVIDPFKKRTNIVFVNNIGNSFVCFAFLMVYVLSFVPTVTDMVHFYLSLVRQYFRAKRYETDNSGQRKIYK